MSISLYQSYKPGNIIHYSTFGNMNFEVVNITNDNLEIRNLKSGKGFNILREDDHLLRSIPLTPEIFTMLGFDVNDDPIDLTRTWKNDFLELISTGENVVSGMEVKNTFKGYKVRDIMKNEELILIGEDYRYVDYVHELQNIYSYNYKKILDVSYLSDGDINQ